MVSTPQPFDPVAYAAQSSGANASAAPPFDPVTYAETTAENPDYHAPTMGGNSWSQAIENAPQAIEAGINRFGLDVAGAPMDFATNVANLGKSAIEAGYLGAGKLPPTWLDPTDPAHVWGTSEWLKNEAKNVSPSIVEPNDPESYLDQGLTAGFEQVGPAPLFSLAPSRIPISIEGESAEVPQVENSQSISAAAAAPDMSGASPELKAEVQRLRQLQTPINQDVLSRHVQAESLPVPTRLTLGQATQDPILISQEQNQRGAMGSFANYFNAQNQNLAKNMEAMRDQVGPDVFSTNQTEHGAALIKAYQAKDEAANEQIKAAYKALRDANKGQFPVDAKTLYNNTEAALHKGLLYEHAPSAEIGQMKRLASSGNMTLEQFEAMRTNLARIMRSSADGNEKAAAGVMREQMEELPLNRQTAQGKALADQARALAKARFDALDADPAYKAAVNESVPPDRFVHRFIVNGNRDDVATMKQNLSSDPAAVQTMGTAALEHLRDQARLDPQFRGNFASASYNKALQALSPKMSALFTPEQSEALENIGDVSRYETAQPRGAYVNNSGTDVSRAAREAGNTISEHAKSIAEQAANAKTFGIGGTLARRLLKGAAERRTFRAHIAPGAGLTYQPSP